MLALFDAPGPGRLVALSMFATGHGRHWGWRGASRVELSGPAGVMARGPGLLPFALQGHSGNIVSKSLLWSHNSLERTGRIG